MYATKHVYRGAIMLMQACHS